MNIEALTKKDVQFIMDEIVNIYTSDEIPWVIGYSGGKDSTAALQLVWYALKDHVNKDSKPIYVITVDTMVESPVIATWVKQSIAQIQEAADDQKLPIITKTLTPEINDTFWVNLLGRGYPFPKTSFRWCTDRLKIKPTNDFVQNMIAKHGEVIMVLGTRKAESAHRQQTLNKFKSMRTREHLNPSTTMANELIYPLLEEWSNDNVWQYLMMEKNPWGLSNKELLTMYRGATVDNECPLVISTDTPSCGSSRFGCWVCTVVEKDKSMAAMIDNDLENEMDWMLPLLELRNEIGDMSKENMRRDFRRMDGSLKLTKFMDENQKEDYRLVHGPYKKAVREEWLSKLLEIQETIRQHKSCPVEDFTIITEAELHIIREIWLKEKHQFDDSLPQIYQNATGRIFGNVDSQKKIFGTEEWDLLKQTTLDVTDDEELLFELQCHLLDLETHASNMRYRHGILSALEKVLQRFYYKNEEDALKFAKEWKDKTESIMSEENANTEDMTGYAQLKLGE